MTSSLFYLAVIASFLSTSNAVTLYFVNNSKEVANNIHDYVVSFDTNTNKVNAYPTSIPSADIILSGAIVCNYSDGSAIYYAAWVAALDGPGILSFNLSNHALASNAAINTHNYHVFMCTSQKNVLLAVSNDFSDPPNYYLDQVTLSGTNSMTRKQIGAFPTKTDIDNGFDTIFSFDASKKELWASWSNSDSDPKTGILEIMDITDGSIKSTYSYPRNYGEPYFTIPETLSGSTFKGANLNDNNVKFVTLSISGDSLSVSNSMSADYLNSEGTPQPICNGTGYAIARDNKVIYSYDINTGKQQHEWQMGTIVGPNVIVGGLAIVCA